MWHLAEPPGINKIFVFEICLFFIPSTHIHLHLLRSHTFCCLSENVYFIAVDKIMMSCVSGKYITIVPKFSGGYLGFLKFSMVFLQFFETNISEWRIWNIDYLSLKNRFAIFIEPKCVKKKIKKCCNQSLPGYRLRLEFTISIIIGLICWINLRYYSIFRNTENGGKWLVIYLIDSWLILIIFLPKQLI